MVDLYIIKKHHRSFLSLFPNVFKNSYKLNHLWSCQVSCHIFSFNRWLCHTLLLLWWPRKCSRTKWKTIAGGAPHIITASSPITIIIPKQLCINCFAKFDSKFSVPLKYLKTLLAIPKCNWLGLSINLDNKLEAYIISSLVAMRSNKFPTRVWYKVASTFFSPS